MIKERRRARRRSMAGALSSRRWDGVCVCTQYLLCRCRWWWWRWRGMGLPMSSFLQAGWYSKVKVVNWIGWTMTKVRRCEFGLLYLELRPQLASTPVMSQVLLFPRGSVYERLITATTLLENVLWTVCKAPLHHCTTYSPRHQKACYESSMYLLQYPLGAAPR